MTDEHLTKLILILRPSEQEQQRIDHLMAIAGKISDGLKAKNWTKSFLAQQLDQHPSVISKWLSGTHNFTATTLLDIQNVLGISIFEKEEEPKTHIVSSESSYSVNNFYEKSYSEIASGVNTSVQFAISSGTQVIEKVETDLN